MYQYDDSNRFRGYLFPSERVLWTGRPKQGLTFSPSDIFAIPFSLLWTGFLLFAFGTTLRDPDNGPPDFMLAVFLILGLYFTVGRFLHDTALRKKISYAVTNERVLTLSGLFSSKLTSLDIHRLPRLEMSERRDDTGTISFENSSWSNFGRMNGLSIWLPSLSAGSQFFRIPNPRKVYELIRNQTQAT